MVFYAVLLLVVTAAFQLLGALVTWFWIKRFHKHQNSILIAEIVIMILVSAEILFLGYRKSALSVFGFLFGLLAVYLLNLYIPHKHVCNFQRLGLLAFAAMCFHELPEGIAFGSTFLLDQRLGLLTAALIALHNIPEGSICAMPYLLKNKFRQAMTLTMVTQVLFILGGLGALFLLVSVDQTIQSIAASIAAGAMVFIAFEELKFLK